MRAGQQRGTGKTQEEGLFFIKKWNIKRERQTERKAVQKGFRTVFKLAALQQNTEADHNQLHPALFLVKMPEYNTQKSQSSLCVQKFSL